MDIPEFELELEAASASHACREPTKRHLRRLLGTITFLILFIACSMVFQYALLLRGALPTQLEDLEEQAAWEQMTAEPAVNSSRATRRPYSEPHSTAISLPGYLGDEEIPRGWCDNLYGQQFLTNARAAHESYCAPGSSSQIDCFWSFTHPERLNDGMCIGRNARFNATERRFHLGCDLKSEGWGIGERSMPRFPDDLQRHWYDTGPGVVYENSLRVMPLLPTPGYVEPGRTTILVKREGEGNVWHCMMEIFSLSLSLDILQISYDDQSGEPYLTAKDADSTQVVLLDDRDDGPFLDAWRIFAKLPIRRLSELDDSEPPSQVIIPYAGASNALWHGNWITHNCRDSVLLQAFKKRVLSHYEVSTPVRTAEIHVTFIDRTSSRRLVNETRLLQALNEAVPHITLEIVDLAGMSMQEQLTIIQRTDVLVGVHGAGLTNLWFLPSDSAVVELLPRENAQMAYRNLAQLLGHRYYRCHADHGDKDWTTEDVEIEPALFVDAVGAAVKGLYASGLRTYDITTSPGSNDEQPTQMPHAQKM